MEKHDLTQYNSAIEDIKVAIFRSQYNALSKANAEQLALYFGIGRYISKNSRKGFWGTGALTYISEKLRSDIPGLRGFSATNLKNMRIFYEGWSCIENSSDASDELKGTSVSCISFNSAGIIANLKRCHLSEDAANSPNLFTSAFLSTPFSHHIYILSQISVIEERIFYIKMCMEQQLSYRALKSAILKDEFRHKGSMPNNFLQRLTTTNIAKRAVLAFKDEYLLDFINVEELGARDIEDVDERVVEQVIVQNIKNFILTFGHDFAFIGNQYRISAMGHDHYIDLLFYNRELSALVAIELKTGEFKNSYLGQLNGYLALLDDYVRKPHENPSIGIVLCKSMDTTYVEYMVRQYDKPMGVATFRTSSEMSEKLLRALPDIEDLKKLL